MCPGPTLVLARQWTLDIPPSGIRPKPMYICGECYGTKFNNKKTEIMNNELSAKEVKTDLTTGSIFEQLMTLENMAYEIKDASIGIERRSNQLANNKPLDKPMPLEEEAASNHTIEEQLAFIYDILNDTRIILIDSHDNFYRTLGQVK